MVSRHRPLEYHRRAAEHVCRLGMMMPGFCVQHVYIRRHGMVVVVVRRVGTFCIECPNLTSPPSPNWRMAHTRVRTQQSGRHVRVFLRRQAAGPSLHPTMHAIHPSHQPKDRPTLIPPMFSRLSAPLVVECPIRTQKKSAE